MNHRDEELIAILTAISVVSKRLAKKLIRLSQANKAFLYNVKAGT